MELWNFFKKANKRTCPELWKSFPFRPNFTSIDLSRICIKDSQRTVKDNYKYKPNEATVQQEITAFWFHICTVLGTCKTFAGANLEVLGF